MSPTKVPASTFASKADTDAHQITSQIEPRARDPNTKSSFQYALIKPSCKAIT